jgi:hypothetical protein
VIEAIPEKITLKISTFTTLEQFAPGDAILATNSSSYKSSEMISGVSEATRGRILNTHYYMPPNNMVVELMTDGFTEAAIFPFLVGKLKDTGALPYVARKESTGFIFNRLWAAVKREALMILSEGVSVPEEIDSMWTEMFIKGRATPCDTMDQVGLDTVASIEQHYIDERGLQSEHTVDFLKKNYLAHGKLGNKCMAGGLFPPKPHNGQAIEPTLIVLDVGLSAEDPGLNAGSILHLSPSGALNPLVSRQSLPDGIDVDHTKNRIFWTCMGTPGKRDGTVSSANLDGSDIRTIVAPDAINTPKQLCIDVLGRKVYFSDREGCAVYRCDYDGSSLEKLVQNEISSSSATDQDNIMNWCVGIAVSPARGKFYWTQKGVSKGGNGRIFCANITSPFQDVKCILDNLPEPIDLDIDETNGRLYWTDRGELPWGNSLNRIDLDGEGLPVARNGSPKPEKQVLSRRFNEAIGLKLDTRNSRVYVTDLGGSIYSCDMDGIDKKVIYSDPFRAFTGIAIV